MPLRRTPVAPQRSSSRPRRRTLTFWAGWDTSVPPQLTDPAADIAAIRADIQSQLGALLEDNALDSAHADTLDSQVAELLAPTYKRLRHEYHFGVRWLKEFDATGRRAQLAARLAAEQARYRATSLEEQADHIYETYVGIPRPRRVEGPDDEQQALELVPAPWESSFRGAPVFDAAEGE